MYDVYIDQLSVYPDISIVGTHGDTDDIGSVIKPLEPAEVSDPAPVNIICRTFVFE